MTKLLTVRKQSWVAQAKPKIITGGVLAPNMAVSARYEARLYKLINRMISETEREVHKLFTSPHAEEYFAMDDTISPQARILMNGLIAKFDKIFSFNSKPIAEAFMDESDDAAAASLRLSLKQLSGGLELNTDILTGELKDVIAASIAENVGLIKSIPEQYLGGVQGAVYRSITTGNGLADLVPFLQKHKNITLKRARLISNDQTRKVYSNINRVRMEKLGIKKFKWRHSGGGAHPRPLHKNVLDGNIYSFDDPPVIDEKTGQKGFPGQLINCRCQMISIMDFSQE